MAVIVAELVAVWLLTPPLPIAIIGAPRDIVVVCKMHHNMLWLMAVFSRSLSFASFKVCVGGGSRWLA